MIRVNSVRLSVAASVCALVLSAVAAPPKVRRARPPKWPDATREIFFSDARTKLIGKRPSAAESRSEGTGPAVETAGAPAVDQFAWSKVISAEVLEDEVKAGTRELQQHVVNSTEFKGGGYKSARASLSTLATMFGIIGQYDASVRWQKEAPSVRDMLARAGFNCKVGTDPAFKEAKARSEDLESLIRTGTFAGKAAESQAPWSSVAGRSVLMQRLERAQQQGLAVWVGSSGEFSKHAAQAFHEAQLIAALAHVIQHEGYESADDEAYLGFARQLEKQAAQAAEAARQNDYAEMRKSVGEIEKTCSACHEGFRG